MNCYKEILSLSQARDYENYLYFYGSKTGIKKFLLHADILAEFFKSLGLKKGDAFTIYMPNTPHAFAAFYALNKIGAVANIVHPFTPVSALRGILAQTRSRGILALDILACKIAQELNCLNIKVILAKTSNYIYGIAKPFFMFYEMFKGFGCGKIKNKICYGDILRQNKGNGYGGGRSGFGGRGDCDIKENTDNKSDCGGGILKEGGCLDDGVFIGNDFNTDLSGGDLCGFGNGEGENKGDLCGFGNGGGKIGRDSINGGARDVSDLGCVEAGRGVNKGNCTDANGIENERRTVKDSCGNHGFEGGEKKDEEENLAALYIHSGGTLGAPKTIVLTNRAVLAISQQTRHIQEEGKGKFTPVVLPIFHAYGLAACVHSSLALGYNQIIFPKFNAKKVNNCLKKYDVAAVISVPLMISKMMAQKSFYSPHLKKLKTVYCGGDTVSKALQEDFNKAVKAQGGSARLLAGYGLTEACGVASVNTDKCYKFSSVGKPLPLVNIEIWEGGANTPLAANQIGEIVISGPTVMSGYLDGENHCMAQKGEVVYIKTGDLGYLDEEGFLFISGRKKSLINIASYNIFPSEIEEVVQKLPFIKEACAVEAKIKGKSAVRLIVSIKEGVPYIKNLRKKILEYCGEYLIKYSIPKDIVFVKELPRTNMSKVDILKVKELYGGKN